jgi:hypothetical protein
MTGGSRIRGRSRWGRRRSGSRGTRGGQGRADEGESNNAELHFDDRVYATGTKEEECVGRNDVGSFTLGEWYCRDIYIHLAGGAEVL